MKRMLKGKETSMTFFHIFPLFSQVAFALCMNQCGAPQKTYSILSKIGKLPLSLVVLTTIKPKLAVDSSPQKTNIQEVVLVKVPLNTWLEMYFTVASCLFCCWIYLLYRSN